MLDNITINQTDLEAVKKDIVSRYLTDNDSYVTAVDAIKKDVYGELKAKLRNSYPSYSNAELDTLMEDVKDLPNEENLTRRIATLSVAKILEYNEFLSLITLTRTKVILLKVRKRRLIQAWCWADD